MASNVPRAARVLSQRAWPDGTADRDLVRGDELAPLGLAQRLLEGGQLLQEKGLPGLGPRRVRRLMDAAGGRERNGHESESRHCEP
jgi:hypothetical protein